MVRQPTLRDESGGLVSAVSARCARVLAVCALLTAGAVAAVPGPASAASGTSELAARLGAGARLVSARGALRFAGAAAHHAGARPGDISATDPAESAARGWLRHYGSAFGISDETHALQVRDTVADHVGRTVRFEQAINGVPVVGAGVVVSMDGTNRLLSVNSRMSRVSLPTTSSLPAATAARVAVRSVARHTGRNDLHAASPRLEILDPAVIGGTTPPVTQMVWTTDVASPDRLVRHTVYVDAARGAVVLDLNVNPTAN